METEEEQKIRHLQLVFDLEVSNGAVLTAEVAKGWLEKYNGDVVLAAEAVRERARAYGHVVR